MATIWLTYAWDDNLEDVDFIAQELEAVGVKVRLDRWNIGAGRRLWDQIENFIQNRAECDAWALLATQASVGSQPCREEFAIALDRALRTRGAEFPIIGLFNGPVNEEIVPASVRARLCVSTTDPNWKVRIKAAAEGTAPAVPRPNVDPYQVRVHKYDAGYAIEMRPRAGSWSPFMAAVPIAEKDALNPWIVPGPQNRLPGGGVLNGAGDCVSDDKQWWMMFAANEATPTQSYYLIVNKMPSRIVFGVHNGPPNYNVSFPAAKQK